MLSIPGNGARGLSMGQKTDPASDAAQTVEAAVNASREAIRAKWLNNKINNHKSEVERLLCAAMASTLSDAAFRILLLRSLAPEGEPLSNDAVAAILRRTKRAVARANSELETQGWVVVQRRRRTEAIRSTTIPAAAMAAIQSEIMENLRSEGNVTSKNLEVTKTSPLEGGDGSRGDANVTSKALEVTKTSLLNPGLWEIQASRSEGNVTSKNLEVTKTSPLEGENGAESVKPDLISARACGLVNNKYPKKEKKDKPWGESRTQNRARAREASQPPSVLTPSGKAQPKAADAIPAVVASCGTQAPTDNAWSHPKAQMAAFSNHHERAAQKNLMLTPDGRLEVSDSFREELASAFPLVEVSAALAAAAPNVFPDRGALTGMQAVRRQFGYMQQDAVRRQKNFDEARKSREENSGNAPKKNKRPIPGMPGLYYSD